MSDSEVDPLPLVGMIHRERILSIFKRAATEKYNNGFIEHGGGLQKMSALELLYEARAETIDQFIYIQTAIEKLEGEP